MHPTTTHNTLAKHTALMAGAVETHVSCLLVAVAQLVGADRDGPRRV
jgi:hypothetical protein